MHAYSHVSDSLYAQVESHIHDIQKMCGKDMGDLSDQVIIEESYLPRLGSLFVQKFHKTSPLYMPLLQYNALDA